MNERLACQLVKQPRGTQRYRPTQRDDEDTLTQAILTLASQYGRYGYCRISLVCHRVPPISSEIVNENALLFSNYANEPKKITKIVTRKGDFSICGRRTAALWNSTRLYRQISGSLPLLDVRRSWRKFAVFSIDGAGEGTTVD